MKFSEIGLKFIPFFVAESDTKITSIESHSHFLAILGSKLFFFVSSQIGEILIEIDA